MNQGGELLCVNSQNEAVKSYPIAAFERWLDRVDPKAPDCSGDPLGLRL
jgi:hypothetical protein